MRYILHILPTIVTVIIISMSPVPVKADTEVFARDLMTFSERVDLWERLREADSQGEREDIWERVVMELGRRAAEKGVNLREERLTGNPYRDLNMSPQRRPMPPVGR